MINAKNRKVFLKKIFLYIKLNLKKIKIFIKNNGSS